MNRRPTELDGCPGRRRCRGSPSSGGAAREHGDDDERARRPEDDHQRESWRVSMREDRAEQDLLGRAGRGAGGRVQVQEQRGQPGRRAEHDAGREVPAARPAGPRSRPSRRADDSQAATNPTSGLTPIRKAPTPPAVETSVSACPANDWPRMTVKTPTIARRRSATAAPMHERRCGPARCEKNPARRSRSTLLHSSAHDRECRRLDGHRSVSALGSGHDQDPAVHAEGRRRGARRAG